MFSNEKIIVLSVGGSLIVPEKGIDISFLKRLRAFILKEVKAGKRFIIVVGGGRTARRYQDAANAVCSMVDEDVDWLGIHSTRLNAHLMRTIFRDIALHYVVKNPTRKITWRKSVLIAAGWKPGRSTDDIAVRLAKMYGSKLVVNLSNIDAVYDSDPRKNKTAKPMSEMSWNAFRALVGNVWHPGANAPFDPIASKLAQREKMTVVVASGDMKNMEKLVDGKKFIGTVIQ